ncbi:MAG: hypothetical protein JWL64_1147 [Frankiales bacterium]|nr:hypothetical protein [Frankiales bacterium]
MTRPRTRTGLIIGLPALAAVLLSGCGAGLRAQTYQPRAAGDSSSVTVDGLAIRHAYVAAPEEKTGWAKGDDVDVTLTVVSQKATDDELVSASSPLAASVELDAPQGGFRVPSYGSSDPGAGLVLRGLTQAAPSASYIPITLVFASGTRAVVDAPVGVDQEAPEVNPSFHVPETDSRGNVVPEAGAPAGE